MQASAAAARCRQCGAELRGGHQALCAECRLRAAYEREQRKGGALPPFEQWRRHRYSQPGGFGGPRVNLDHRRLEALHRRGCIDDRQLAAGLHYRRAWEISGLEPRVTAPLDERTGGGETSYGMAFTEVQAHWRQVLRRAQVDIGVFHRRVADAVCVEDRTLAEVARMCGFRLQQRAAQTRGGNLVRAALDALADHWRISAAPAHPMARGGKAVVWRSPDFALEVDPRHWREEDADDDQD